MVVNERHLQAVLAEFADYYNRDRPHRSLRMQSPIPEAARSSGRGYPSPSWVACTTPIRGVLESGRIFAPFGLVRPSLLQCSCAIN